MESRTRWIAGNWHRALNILLITALGTFAIIVCGDDRAEAAILVKKRREVPILAATARPSTLELSLHIPLTKIMTVANQYTFQIDNAGSFFGFQYDATIFPDELKIEPSRDEQYPIALSTHFRFAGHASGRVVEGTGTAAVRLAIKIGPDWCPIVKVSPPSIEWTQLEAPAAVAFAIRTGLIDHIIAKELAKITECSELKRSLATVWQAMTLPIGSPANTKNSAKNALYLNMSPQSISIKSIGVTNGRLSAKITVASSMSIDPQASKKRKLPLPDPGVETLSKTGDEDIELLFLGNIRGGP